MFRVFLMLGVSAFGGPVAHLGHFRREIVERRRWLDEETYADVVALCQSLPGPASSQVGIAIGLLRAGPVGALAAWLGFTLPSAALMVTLAYTIDRASGAVTPVIRALELVALGVVVIAVWRMARALAPDPARVLFVVAAAVAVLYWRDPIAQLAVIAAAAVLGRLLLPAPAFVTRAHQLVPIGRRVALGCAALYVALLIALPLARLAIPSGELRLAESFYRSGALVFGGGHVVLPLLHAEVVPAGWVSEDRFLAGYGAAQAMPGPLFTFAAYLGAAVEPQRGGDLFTPWPPGGLAGAAIALVSIFLPAFLLVFAALPSWGALRARPWAQSALRGVNAAVVGLLLAALITLAARVIASLAS